MRSSRSRRGKDAAIVHSAFALAVSCIGALVLASAAWAPAMREGGTFNFAVRAGSFDTIDPALVDGPAEVGILAPACATLLAYPNRPPPEGLRLRPDLAAAQPVVANDGKTYTFTIRSGLRFSSGERVTAAAFGRALERLFGPELKSESPIADLRHEVLGAAAYRAGTARTIRGVAAKGRTLTLKLTKQDSLLPSALTNLCAVPPNLPADPQGAGAPLPSPAPYYVAEYVPGERLRLRRNRFYSGERPHHVDGFVADLGADAASAIDDVISGKLDWASSEVALRSRAGELARRFGVNKHRFFVRPATFLRMFVLNTSRPLFRNNPKLRQAVNFAADRAALTRELGAHAGTPTDQYLWPAFAGFRDTRIYPVKGPDLKEARALAKGNLRSGKAVLYTTEDPIDVAQAQILQRNLAAIGLRVKIVTFPGTLLFDQLAAGRSRFDIGRIAWSSAPPDPSWFAGLFDGRTLGRPTNTNYSYFDSARYNRLIDRAAALSGGARLRAYRELDVHISRDAAPAVPVAILNAFAFVSGRVGCVVMDPFFDLTAVCLK